jgi:hypothetical protein
LIPFEYHGFVWKAENFQELSAVGEYRTNALPCKYRNAGAGVPLVVTRRNRNCDPLMPDQLNFAATLCLRCGEFSDDADPQSVSPALSPALELYDPLRCERRVADSELIARDLTAPLVFGLQNQSRTILNDFLNLRPSSEQDRLYLTEPFQSGKIPVVLIHGLVSDPFTWVSMVNELRATPWFVEHYQLWAFNYQTGRSFLASSATLRQQLRMVRERYDPEQRDPQFSKMVLIGHSMGGLVSKLQIASSGDALWSSVAQKPFDQVHIPEAFRELVHDSFFFEPSTDVARVVFIGTPHKGSSFASRFIGRLGSALVRPPDDYQSAHEQLIACNPGVFSREVEKRIPTSIDLLDPNSRLLQAVSQLPINELQIKMHSVIGDAHSAFRLERSDGVVPLESAREYRVQSELIINSTHSNLNKAQDTILEVKRILLENAQSKMTYFQNSSQ